MADNVQLNAGSGGDVIAADDVAGVKYQLIQLVKGSDGGAKTLITGSSGLPVEVVAALPAGSNAIGKLAANDGVGIGDVTVNNAAGAGVYVRPGTGVNLDTSNVTIGAALPAGSNLLGAITAQLDTGTIRNGAGTALTPKFAAIAAASSGNNTLVAAVASKKIRVIALAVLAAGAVNIYFDDSGATVLLGGSTNKMNLAANGGFVLPFNPVGWMETGSGNGLRVNLSGAVALSGGLVYLEV